MATNSNTLPVTIRGRYVCSSVREWGAFQADDGKTVEAGKVVRIYVLDQADNLREIKATNIPGLDALTFGVEVQAECEARPYKGQLTFTAVSVQRTSVKAA